MTPTSNRSDEQGSAMTGWLLCRLDRGMFSDEVAVTYPAASLNHWQKSVFVPLSLVRSASEHRGEVKVKVVIRDGARFAVLPTPWGDTVRVEGTDLRQS